MLALPKEVQNVLVLPTVGNAKNYLVYIVGLHGDKGKSKTHFGQNIYSAVYIATQLLQLNRGKQQRRGLRIQEASTSVFSTYEWLLYI